MYKYSSYCLPMSFKISKQILIEKPRDHVWTVLTNWEKYSEWNPLTHKVDVLHEKKVVTHSTVANKLRKQELELQIQENTMLMTGKAQCGITIERVHSLIEVPSEVGRTKTIYSTDYSLKGFLQNVLRKKLEKNWNSYLNPWLKH